jgi:hypothetical protein
VARFQRTKRPDGKSGCRAQQESADNFPPVKANSKNLLDFWGGSAHMGFADVMQLDHCFPFRLQSFDLDTD